jgi:ATP-binding cassette subfamily B protein
MAIDPRTGAPHEPRQRHGGPDPLAGRSLAERFGALRNLPPFLKLAWKTSPRLTALGIALRLIRALLPVATLYVGKLIIDEVVPLARLAVGQEGLRSLLASGAVDRLTWLLVLELGLAIVADVIGRLSSMIDTLLSERLANATSVRLMEHAATLDLEEFEDSEQQDRLDRARRQTMGRMTLITQILGQAQDVVTVTAFAAGLVAYAPWLIALLLLAVVPAFLGEAHFNARSYALNYWRAPERRELDYLRQTGASLETAKEVKIFGLSSFLVERYRRLAADFYDANRRLAARRAAWGAALAALGTLGYYLAYAFIAWRTVQGVFTIGDLTFLSASFRRLRGLLEGLLTSVSQVAGQALYLDDLFSFFDIEPAIVSPASPLPFPTPIREGFRFEDVGFRYEGAERWAVRHLDFALEAGEVLALVGENGAGKTTLVKLLARLYDPDEGRILLDGHDLREYDLGELRANIGVIFQDFVRYHLTAAENIAVGRIEARGDRARIHAAGESSLAHEVIERLPLGYDQMIGKRFRTGVDLSAGEWQKVAIARAYMRGAQLLILDEPTASLDARSEFEVFQRFKELARGKRAVLGADEGEPRAWYAPRARLAVLISHRFSSVRMADRILVLADGEIEEAGTHEQLLAQGGRYAELFELQAAGYR